MINGVNKPFKIICQHQGALVYLEEVIHQMSNSVGPAPDGQHAYIALGEVIVSG